MKLLCPIVACLVATIFEADPASAISPQATAALAKMQVAEGFQVQLIASEPEIRQPLSITFDERGRMWIIQYLQYPTPAGLTAVKVDQYLRTKYDRMPEPPPRGPRGADRITICDFALETGASADGEQPRCKFKDFVSGLNLCSGMVLGHGGLFVLQPPYLLFYPDKNRDDIPDADPEVLLTGFGLEDAHALANSLTWGPDGWLYGAQGSTVTANIRGIEFQQGIWRYHPLTKEFELFAEGGGNTWGLDFDDRGEVLAGTNFDDKMLHQVQGAYYVKNFGKHGELHNPHAYGYFGHVPYTGYRGGHISIGGVVYHGGTFPKEFSGAYVFGNTLDHAVYWARLQPHRSSFTATFAGTLLKTDDELFRPVDCEVGPDGAVYVADWCDKRASHVDSLDTWDRSNGRIYRIQKRGAKPMPLPENSSSSKNLTLTPQKDERRASDRSQDLPKPGLPTFDLRELSSDNLVDLLEHPNQWFARKARLLLAERRDTKVLPRLRDQIFNGHDAKLALQSLWVVYVSGGFDEPFASTLVTNSNENIRAWTVRLLGDSRKIGPGTAGHLVKLAREDSSPVVRAQLACTAKRLPASEALPIVRELLHRDEDANDPHVPMLLWWALEDKAITNRAAVRELFSANDIWQRAMVDKFILERLTRRYADEGGEVDYATCARLLEMAPEESRSHLLDGLEQAMQGRTAERASLSPLRIWFAEKWPTQKANFSFLRLGLRLQQPEAKTAVLGVLNQGLMQEQRSAPGPEDRTLPTDQLIELVDVIGQTAQQDWLEPLLQLFNYANSDKVREAALRGLRNYSSESVGKALIHRYPKLSKALRAQALNALGSRPEWALQLLDAVDAGTIDPKDLTLDRVKQMAALNDPSLQKQLEKRWGKIRPDSPQDKQNAFNRIKLVLKPSGVVGRDPKGNVAEGRKVFQAACAICHKLFGEGNSVGPDLSGTDRKNIDYLLEQIINPNAYIRPEYAAFEAEMRDGRLISGLMTESTPSTTTLLDRNNERHLLSRDQIQQLRESAVSLMPEGLLEGLQPAQIMDLFAYLQSDH